MNVYLLGNGFDLYHSFPTSYINFINVAQHLIKHYSPEIHTVGEVLGHSALHDVDSAIKRCYTTHTDCYNQVVLDQERVVSLIDEAKRNVWFNYLSKVCNFDLGWIDFEKEIANVIDVFREFLADKKVDFTIGRNTQTRRNRYIFSFFDFFYQKQDTGMGAFLYKINEQYTYEDPFGSQNYVSDNEKIISKLYQELIAFNYMLGDYLHCFVDVPLSSIKECQTVKKRVVSTSDVFVFTFNYTKASEVIYSIDSSSILHLHGTVDKLILGVNPDRYDQYESIDTTFVQFKKYYQRICDGIDEKYQHHFSNLQHLKKYNQRIDLHVIGHSLDISDEDILKEVFELSSSITIHYHNNSAHCEYVKKMILLYGKKGFDDIRKKKAIRFVPLEPLEWS